MSYLFQVLSLLCSFYMLVLLGRVVFDITGLVARNWAPQGLLLVLANLIYALTDPPLRLLNRFLPPLRLGVVSLDVGFFVLFLAVSLLGRFASVLAYTF